MAWRIYRLPGSREFWHVDSGPNTAIVNVYGFDFKKGVETRSVDIKCGHPRAWIEIPFENTELYIIQGRATWVAAAAVPA